MISQVVRRPRRRRRGLLIRLVAILVAGIPLAVALAVAVFFNLGG